MYPHFDIYPTVQGNCADRSYGPGTVPGTPVVRRALFASSSASNTGSSLQADRSGYPVLNICAYFPLRDPHILYRRRSCVTRCSDHHNLDPAVYPHFEIYPKVQTVQSRAKIKSHLHSDREQGFGEQPWGFGWPSFRPASSPVPTSSSVTSFTLSPVLKSAMAYPVIEICKSPATWTPFIFANCGARRPCSLSLLRPVPCRGTAHPFQPSYPAKIFGGKETWLPGDGDM